MGWRLAFRTARIAVPGLIVGTIIMVGTGLSAAAARPPVTVTPTEVLPGGTLRVSGPSCVIASGGVGVGGVIVALKAPKQAASAASLSNGPWKTAITVPADEPPGRYQITALCTFANVGGGKRSFRYRPVTVNVGPPPGARVLGPIPASAPGGRRILRVDGAQGCVDTAANVLSVAMFYDSQATPIGVGTAAVGGSTVDVPFMVPAHATAGAHRLHVACWLRGSRAPKDLTVAALHVTTPRAPPSPTIRAAGQRTDLSRALPGRSQVPFGLISILKSLGLAALLVVLVGFPAEIFNSTLEENYAEVRGWLRRLQPPARLARRLRLPPPAQFAVFCALAALLSALVDPEIIFHEHAWASKGLLLFAGFVVAIPVTTMAFAAPAEGYLRQVSGVTGQLRALPLALVIAAVFVVVSQAGHFVPGYVYGLIAGYGVVQARKLEDQYEGRAVLIGAAQVLALGLLVWIGWEPIRVKAAGPHPAEWVLILDSILSLTVILSLQAIVFGLLPLKFMPGGKLRQWSLRAWIAVYGTAAFFFVHLLLLNTEPVTNAQHMHAITTTVTLFIAFAIFSTAFWAYFRYRPEDVDQGQAKDAEAAAKTAATETAETASAGNVRAQPADISDENDGSPASGGP
jgi:hypothetical protein